jgi:hypothetical protein
MNISEIDYYKPFIDQAMCQFSGIYTPKHVLNTTTEFKKAINDNLKLQKQYLTYKKCIDPRDKNKDLANIIIKSFNLQCNELIKQLNGYNLDSIKKEIEILANELIDHCNAQQFKVLTHQMILLKVEQAELETDYLIFQADEKYRKYMQVQMLKDQEKAMQEWTDRLQDLKEHELYYSEVLRENPNDEYAQHQRAYIDQHIESAEYALKNYKAGWVYIISNDDMIDGIYKIGLTKRPSPIVRINELSNASHAFKFKIHALIYSDDCFALETALHRRFADRRLNKDNYHKEFYCVELDELQQVLKDEFDIDCAMNDNIFDDDELLEKYYNITDLEEYNG